MGIIIKNILPNKKIYIITLKNKLNKKFCIVWILLMFALLTMLFISFNQYAMNEMKSISIYSYIYFILSDEYIVYLIIPIFQISCIQAFTNLNAHSFTEIIKYKNRNDYFKKIFISNAMISMVYTLFIFISLFLTGILGGLSFTPDYKTDLAKDIFYMTGQNNANNILFIFLIMIAFFTFLLIIGLIYAIIYYLSLKSVFAYVCTFVILFFNMRLQYMGFYKILMFQKNVYFSEWIVQTINGKIFCICFWMTHLIILTCALEYCINKIDFVSKKSKNNNS